ncbi:VOC family protein [Ramlibacter sp. MAHUQ-53]|uniref:VOC family protein n=1 Tax=unclassified Ramlibacter TaxID=2617605 RepID=UPI003627AC82
MTIRPKTFAHVVFRTYRFEQMLQWYFTVFGGKVQYQSPVIAFVTYDEEHHRIALLNMGIIKGESQARTPRGEPGMDHVAYGYRGLQELMDKYLELKAKGILPYWCIHHGITISLYYADPDGNQMEFQADCFGTNDDANAFMHGPHFEANPIGVEFDPDEMVARLRDGVPASDILPRRVQLPVSPVRGSLMA